VPVPSGEGFLVSGYRTIENTSKSVTEPKNPPERGKRKD